MENPMLQMTEDQLGQVTAEVVAEKEGSFKNTRASFGELLVNDLRQCGPISSGVRDSESLDMRQHKLWASEDRSPLTKNEPLPHSRPPAPS